MIRPCEKAWAAALAALVSLAGCGEGGRSGAEAVDCIRDMTRYAREGRVGDYLNCFDAPLRAKLEGVRDKGGPGEFAASLRRRAEPVRGVAFSDETRLDESTVRVKVEWVFTDRNEIQSFMLRKGEWGWKIADMTEAQYKKPLIPYGTKVFE